MCIRSEQFIYVARLTLIFNADILDSSLPRNPDFSPPFCYESMKLIFTIYLFSFKRPSDIIFQVKHIAWR